jgi:hypothetical protein
VAAVTDHPADPPHQTPGDDVVDERGKDGTQAATPHRLRRLPTANRFRLSVPLLENGVRSAVLPPLGIHRAERAAQPDVHDGVRAERQADPGKLNTPAEVSVLEPPDLGVEPPDGEEVCAPYPHVPTTGMRQTGPDLTGLEILLLLERAGAEHSRTVQPVLLEPAGDEMVLLQSPDHRPKPVLVDLVVRVTEGNPPTPGVLHPEVARRPRTPDGTRVHDPQARQTRPVPLGNLKGRVGGPVVAQQELPRHRTGLRSQRLELDAYRLGTVETSDNHAQERLTSTLDHHLNSSHLPGTQPRPLLEPVHCPTRTRFLARNSSRTTPPLATPGKSDHNDSQPIVHAALHRTNATKNTTPARFQETPRTAQPAPGRPHGHSLAIRQIGASTVAVRSARCLRLETDGESMTTPLGGPARPAGLRGERRSRYGFTRHHDACEGETPP